MPDHGDRHTMGDGNGGDGNGQTGPVSRRQALQTLGAATGMLLPSITDLNAVRTLAAPLPDRATPMTFADLALSPRILDALAEEGYTTPTPIQAQSIPLLIEGRDILGMAQTGTGKTAAFALPLLHRLAANPRPAPKGGARILVLAPTRELVSQIAAGFESFGRHLSLSVTTIFGGVSQFHQVAALS